MKIMYTTEEGGELKPLTITVPNGDIFAIYLPDGTVWDKVIGVDKYHQRSKEEFDLMYKEVSSL